VSIIGRLFRRGPDPEATNAVLDMLAKRNVSGQPAANGQAIVRELSFPKGTRALAVIDLPSLAPLSDSRIEAAGAAWALAADPARGLLYVADELATEIRVFDVNTGRIAAAIPLAFSLRVEVRDEDDKPPPSAVVHLLWSIRGREVLVRARETDASGVVVFNDLIAGSSYVVNAMTASAESLGRTAEAAGPITVHQSPNPVTIEPHRTAHATVTLKSDFAQMFYGGEPQLLAGNDRAPATSLVVADMAVDPVSGLLYVTGSDLDRGHLFVIDPDERRIVHDWHVRAGIGDIVPRGDGQSVYVANRAFSTVSLVDVATGETRQSAGVPSWPEAITVDRAGNVFVASLRDGSVTRLEADTLEVSAERDLEEGVHRLALLPDGSALLVANIWTDTITALDPTDLGIAFLLPVTANPHALAVDPGRRKLIVGTSDRGTVSIYETDTFDLAQQVTLDIRIRDIATVPVPA